MTRPHHSDSALLAAEELSPVDLLESCIARIEEVNPAVNALVTRCFERACAEGEAAERVSTTWLIPVKLRDSL